MASFTVVIPTRNRAGLVADAIASVVAQDGADFEVIVSDNSTSTEQSDATRAAVEAVDDRRVRYIRPPEPLPMPAHWEFATQKVANDYLLIHTDRFVMGPGALAHIDQCIADRQPDLVFWQVSATLDADGNFMAGSDESGATRVRAAQDVLAEHANCDVWRTLRLGTNFLPRGLNSAVHRSLLETVRSKFGQVYWPIAPDYTSAFLFLAHAREQLEIDRSLCATNGDVSNGSTVIRDGLAAYDFGAGIDPRERVPLPIDTVFNVTIRDYLFAEKLCGMPFPPLNQANYLLCNLRELQLKRALGTSLDLAAMRKAIFSAADRLPAAERAAFDEGAKLIALRDTAIFRLRERLARTGLTGLAKRLLGKLRPA